MRINHELISQCSYRTNALLERQLDMKGMKISEIENLSATLNYFDAIDLSNNDISLLSNSSLLKK